MSNEMPLPGRKEFHVVRQDGEQVLLHVPSYVFFAVTPETASFMRDYGDGLPVRDCCARCGASEKEAEELFTNLKEHIDRDLASFREHAEKLHEAHQNDCGKRILERLTLNVSNDCNLRCRYCYASGGSYGQDRGMMTIATAIATVDAAYREFDDLRAIQFFGGEPGLNPAVIRAVCAHCQDLQQQGKIEHPPSYGMVTNGTVHSRAFLSVIRKYRIGATVSLDGPQAVNDAVRVGTNGRGKFSRSMQFIRRLQQEDRSWVGIEGTFTRAHLEHGLTVVDVMDFLAEELGIRSSHIPAVGAPADPTLSLYPECMEQTEALYAAAVTHTIRTATTGNWRALSLAERQVRAFAEKRGMPVICPASGTATLSVSADGEVYPCFMFIGKPEFRMSNVTEDGFSGPGYQRVNELFQQNAKANREDCRDCWARGVCSGCLGANCNETGSIYEVPQHHCRLVKTMAEQTLVELTKVKREPQAWTKLVENMTHWPARVGDGLPAEDGTSNPGSPAP